MALDQFLETHREEILRICAKHGARNVRVFGSFARGRQDLRVMSTSWLKLVLTIVPGFQAAYLWTCRICWGAGETSPSPTASTGTYAKGC